MDELAVVDLIDYSENDELAEQSRQTRPEFEFLGPAV